MTKSQSSRRAERPTRRIFSLRRSHPGAYRADAQIPGNNGCFRVEFGAGESDVRRTDEAPDVRMDIRAFSRAICGLEDGPDPEWQSGVELLCDPAEAGKLFYRKPCYIEQYF